MTKSSINVMEFIKALQLLLAEVFEADPENNFPWERRKVERKGYMAGRSSAFFVSQGGHLLSTLHFSLICSLRCFALFTVICTFYSASQCCSSSLCILLSASLAVCTLYSAQCWCSASQAVTTSNGRCHQAHFTTKLKRAKEGRWSAGCKDPNFSFYCCFGLPCKTQLAVDILDLVESNSPTHPHESVGIPDQRQFFNERRCCILKL